MNQKHILLVDDDPLFLEATQRVLKGAGYETTTCQNGKRALTLLQQRTFDVVITDLVMQPLDGMEVLKETKRIQPEAVVMILTGYGDMDSAIKALRLSADDYLVKPCEREELLFRVAKCLEKKGDRKKIRTYERLLSICCGCNKILVKTEDDQGQDQWLPMDDYVRSAPEVRVTGVYCPECAKKDAEEY